MSQDKQVAQVFGVAGLRQVSSGIFIKEKARRSGLGGFCYEVFPTLGYFTRPMRTVSRLRLLFFSFNIYSDVLSTSILLTQSILCMAHQKHNHVSYVSTGYEPIDYASGGPFGHCPRVLNPFLSASYSNN